MPPLGIGQFVSGTWHSPLLLGGPPPPVLDELQRLYRSSVRRCWIDICGKALSGGGTRTGGGGGGGGGSSGSLSGAAVGAVAADGGSAGGSGKGAGGLFRGGGGGGGEGDEGEVDEGVGAALSIDQLIGLVTALQEKARPRRVEPTRLFPAAGVVARAATP